MKQRPSLILGWLLAGLCLLAFFLPWARFAPEAAGANVLGLANTLAAGEDDPVSSYLWMKRAEARAALRDPADGLSGWQLTRLASGNAPRVGLAPVVIDVMGVGDHLRWVVLVPGLALAGALALTPMHPPQRVLAGLAIALAAAYGTIRWKLNSVYTERLLQHIDLNLGFWIFAFSATLLALLLALRALLPPKTRF